LCLIRNHNDKKRADIKSEIKNSLLGGPKGLHELVADLTIGTEKRRIEIIRELLDAGKIRLDENLYSWDTLF
jgi:ATP-dependent DNA helicase RecQ